MAATASTATEVTSKKLAINKRAASQQASYLLLLEVIAHSLPDSAAGFRLYTQIKTHRPNEHHRRLLPLAMQDLAWRSTAAVICRSSHHFFQVLAGSSNPVSSGKHAPAATAPAGSSSSGKDPAGQHPTIALSPGHLPSPSGCNLPPETSGQTPKDVPNPAACSGSSKQPETSPKTPTDVPNPAACSGSKQPETSLNSERSA